MTAEAPFRFTRRMEISLVLTAVFFVLALAGAAAWGGAGQAWAALRALPVAVIPVLLGMSAFNYLMRGARWLLFSAAIGLDIPVRANALIYVAGFALTTTPGKVGEALRLWLLRTGFGKPYDRTITLLIGDRLADAVSTCILLALTVAWMSAYVSVSVVAIAVVAAGSVLLVRPVLLLHVVDAAYRMIGRKPRVFVRVRRAVRQLAVLAVPRVFGAAMLLGVAGWLSEGLSLYVLVHALGVAIAPLACVFIFAFAMIVGAISVLPGGLGSTEATMIGLLATQGVALETAIVATAVVRITTLWFAVGLGLLALPLAWRRVRADA